MVKAGRKAVGNASLVWAVDAVDGSQNVEGAADEARCLFAETEANQAYIDGLLRGPESARRQRLQAVILLGNMLESMGIDPRRVSLGREATGRPFLLQQDNMDISLSHSARYVACAVLVGEGRVGIDVEEYGRWTDERACRAMERFFGPEERAEAHTAEAFVRLWTLKEAICKLDGRGNPLRVDTARLTEDVWHDTCPVEGGQLTVAASAAFE